MHVIGIDSGASGSDAAIADYDGNIIFSRKFEPLNFNLSGYLRTAETISNIISISVKESNADIKSLVVGIAGARFKKDRDMIKRELERIHNIKKVLIIPDTELAFGAYFNENQNNCGILIAGTGSIFYYKDSDNKMKRIGGWGRLIDDEGSGYWIGREALNRVAKYYDSRAPYTTLAAVVRRKYGMNPRTMVSKIYHENFDIAQIAENVCQCAAKGDKVSGSILYEAAYRLSRHFEGLKNKKMVIGLNGSLLKKSEFLRTEFFKIMNETYPKIHVLYEMKEPLSGAIKTAINRIR